MKGWLKINTSDIIIGSRVIRRMFEDQLYESSSNNWVKIDTNDFTA